MALGYAYLHHALGLSSFPPSCPARVGPVLKIVRQADHLAVPQAVADRLGLSTGDPFEHLLFALKHEGINLALLMEAMRHLPADRLVEAMRASPSSGYVRKACYLWEAANGATLEDVPVARGAVVDLFDPARYVTMAGTKDPKWRVHFNGLGSIRYCATVERSAGVEAALASRLIERIHEYTDVVGSSVRDRALDWAYLDETRSSFAIEHEVPSEDKQRAFVALLHAAHRRQDLTEDYLVQLQTTTVSSPFDRASGFRTEQNHLGGPLRGALGVTYVPPPPMLCAELMEELMTLVNRASGNLDPLLAGAVASFGFVFLHPFMDGNGRLSRFLVHYALCQSGRMENGLILPVSIAMKAHEDEYLATLRAFSAPARERWEVQWFGEDSLDLSYKGRAGHEFYRYWDATLAVEFCHRMAEQALEVNLRENTEFILRHDYVTREVDRRYDVRGSDLVTLVTGALTQGGIVSKRRRDQFATRVRPEVFDLIQEKATEALGEEPLPIGDRGTKT